MVVARDSKEMPAKLREMLAASVARPPPLVVCFFPLANTEWALCARRSLIAYDSDEGRASRRDTFSRYLVKGNDSKLARFAAACAEADTQWLPLTGSDARRNWLQCDGCGKWRAAPADLEWSPQKGFSCAEGRWAPALARCVAGEEPMAEVEMVEAEGGGEEEGARAPAGDGGSGGGGGGGGGGNWGSVGNALDYDTEAETEPETELLVPPHKRPRGAVPLTAEAFSLQ